MKSMTGYGKATAISDDRELTVEIKSVNHRFFDLNCKLPKNLIFAEDVLRKGLQEHVVRGRVDAFVSYVDKREQKKSITLDLNLAEAYVSAAKRLNEELGVQDDLTTAAILRIPELVRSEVEEDDVDALAEMMRSAAIDAAKMMDAMRLVEGKKLKDDLVARLDVLEELLGKVRERAPIVVSSYREKLELRMREVLENVNFDEARLLNEVAFFADKANIDEEMTRLASHISQVRKLFESNEAIGRKLDFIVQELHRETNTICSKSNDLDLTNLGLAMKAEVEKIREQVQNVE